MYGRSARPVATTRCGRGGRKRPRHNEAATASSWTGRPRLRQPTLHLGAKLGALFQKLFPLLFHPCFQGFRLGQALLSSILPDVLGDLHGTEMGAAHATEVGSLGAFLRKGLVVELASGFGV